jgi:trimeric autotransporter adhesin
LATVAGGDRNAASYFYTTAGGVAPNGTSWSTLSGHNAKKKIRSVDGEEILSKLVQVPVSHWNYESEQDTDTPNLGPMAQDFKHAFYPRRDDKTISTLEFDGVELAAIQALNKKLEQKDAQIQDLQKSVAELKSMIQQLTIARSSSRVSSIPATQMLFAARLHVVAEQ